MNTEITQMHTDRISDTNTRVRVKAGVGIVICDNEDRLLLERRSDNGMWGLPGGGIEPGESVIETAIREAKEETNLDIRITGLVGIYSEPSDGRIVTYPDNADVVQLVDIVLTAKIESGELFISSESLELKFFTHGSFPPDIVPPAVQPLKDFIAGKNCIIR